MEDLFRIASLFRTAIEEAVRYGEIREMATFPCGCCAFASELLQRYLIEQYDVPTWYVSGRYGYGWTGESHAWLETQDKVVIDITGDQYKYSEQLRFTEPVYIGVRRDGFHDKFELDEPLAYSKSEDQNQGFDRRYKVVTRHLKNEN